MESYVIKQLNEYVLTEENMRDLVRLTNEDSALKCQDETGRIDFIKAEIEDTDNRLGKLYDALETGEFKGGELAPRLKALFDRKTELEKAKIEAEEAVAYQTIELPGSTVVNEYINDIKKWLEDSSIMSRKTFLRSFMERIEVDNSIVKLFYKWPFGDSMTDLVGVLPIINDSPPFKIPTTNYQLPITHPYLHPHFSGKAQFIQRHLVVPFPVQVPAAGGHSGLYPR